MKKRKTIVLSVVVLTLFLSGCSLGKQPTPTPSLQTDYVPVISVTGELLPERWAVVSHKAGGKAEAVLVEPGDEVAAGEVLVRLDATELESSLQAARQNVAALQAALEQLIDGASQQVIERADRENAEQVALAQIALKLKEQQLEQARAQDPSKDVVVAQAGIRRLEAQQKQVRAQDPVAEVTLAQVELERAKIALDDTQNEYNKALDRPWEDQEIRDAWAKQLEQAQLNYRSAQAQLDRATTARRAHALSLNALEVQLEEARVMLEQAMDAQDAYTITLSMLREEVEAAKLSLDHLRAWENPYRDEPSDKAVDQARARVQQAEWTVRQIEQQIEDTEIKAPFAATVGVIDVREGELVSPGQALLTVGELDTLRVETTDLDEIQVVQVSTGQKVIVTFDALPDRTFPGRVIRISPMAEPGTGGVHYAVLIDLDELDPVLRWGMTAFVDIEVD